ncbi:hypothetical protein KR222_006445 [Zaprionus bogoriensis]|nr:hypothetical protein KR222_006445 [Zaprionus bogoriensis]
MPATFGLLFHQNMIIELSLWRRTVFEIITVFIMLIIILVNPVSHSKKLLYSRQDYKGDPTMIPHKLDDINILTSLVEAKREQTKYKLAYTPQSAFVQDVVRTVALLLELNGTIGFDNSEVLQNQFDERTTLAAIVFENIEKDQETVPKVLSFSIRFPSEFRTLSPFLTEDRLWLTRCSGVVNAKRDNTNDKDIKQDIYIREGFLQLQHLVFIEWLHRLRGFYPPAFTEPQVEVLNVRLRMADERCSTMDLYTMPSFLYNFVYLLPFINIIRNIAGQLKDGVPLHQWHYGYSFSKQYLCQFLVIFIRLIILGIFIVSVIFVTWSIENEGFNGLALLAMILFIALFTIELILVAVVVAKIFVCPVNAVLFAVVVWLFNYAAFDVILKRYWEARGGYVMFILSTFFTNQFSFSFQMFHRYIVEPTTIEVYDFGALYLSALIHILIDLIVLFLLQWRMPGRLISRRMIFGRRKINKKTREISRLISGRSPNLNNFEFGDVGSIEMVHLKHIYTLHLTSARQILKNVSLRIYMGEVYILLGHIGSGKLTLLRVLCGLKYPLKGSVHYMGKDFYADMRGNRKLIDFRSVENGLVSSLTLEQSIKYHVKLKLNTTKDKKRVQEETRKWVEILGTYITNRQARICQMTKGERKLVALCCAMACDTQIIVLEEPTVHLTQHEAQVFWSIIAMEKQQRAIVIATYSIDETVTFADRIGIISLGVLEASGTPFFLRSKFSTYVELVLIKKPHVSDVPITLFISQYIPNVEPDNEIGDTLTYRIDKSDRPKLQKMLIHLEHNRKELGIENIRIVGSEMSDVYMKLVRTFRLQQQIIPDVTQTFKFSVVSKTKLRRQQMRAMFYKKMVHSAPNLWPIIMVFASCVLIVIITRLGVVLDLPTMRKNSIPLGFKGAEEYIKDIPDVQECGYIDIRSVAETPIYKKSSTISRKFESQSFVCVKSRYKDDLNNMNVLQSLGAVEMEGEQDIRGYISQDTFHSAPMLLNLLHNIILRLSYPNDQEFKCLVDNHPMPTSLTMKINLLDNEIAHINAPLAIGCILPLTVSVFVLPLAEENITHLRILQIISGLGLNIYWGISFVWDFFTYCVYAVIIVIIVACTNIGEFGYLENLLLLLLITIFGLAAIPITYVISMYVRKSIVRAYLTSVLFHGITGLVLYIIYWDVANSNAVFFYGACILPGFALLDGISNIYIRCLEERLCTEKCSNIKDCNPGNMHEIVPHCVFDTYFQWADPGILPAITFMLLACLIALIFMFWVELHRREKKFHSSKDMHKLRTATYDFDDSDVADVKQKIADADMSKCKQSVFLVDQVESKIPARGTKLNTVSFALNKYMSMGIFGPRNSGKSHLIRQLVGIDGFAFGEIYVRGLDFKYDLDTILGYVGYCPQWNGLLGGLTAREHIRLMCMIRGVPEDKISEKMRDLCLMLNMTGWMHRKCRNLTPEKRRKLNIALCLVAYNKILILDEPTRGMPSTTRREIWNILRYLRYCGKTTIFATSDELECKMLADFVILFQDSEMLAIGSMQYLCYKYSHGFYLEVRLVRDGATLEESLSNLRKDVENLTRFVHFLHDKSELVTRMHNWFKYYVPVGHIVYSFLYGAMEKNKVRLNISDYCIYQASMGIVIAKVQETRAELKRGLVVMEANRQTNKA